MGQRRVALSLRIRAAISEAAAERSPTVPVLNHATMAA